MRPTMQDVARRAGVSSATVSRALSNSPKVSQETRQRVLKVIEEMGYSPNLTARSLRVQRSPLIGMIISDIRNPFFTYMVRAVEDVARQQGHSLVLCNSDEDVSREAEYMALMSAERVRGVIVIPADERRCPAGKLLADGIPVVSLDRSILAADVDTVVLDNRQSASTLVNLLIAGGHTRISAIVGPQGSTTGRQRLEGFLEAHGRHNLQVAPELIRQVAPTHQSGLKHAGGLMDLAEPPTALFLGNNLLMQGALRAIQMRELSIPKDMAVVGIDHMDWMPLFRPRLTVIKQPTYEMGRLAADLLFQRAANMDLPIQKVMLHGQIVEGESHHACNPARVMDYA